MGKSSIGDKSMAADLKKRGIHHGTRRTVGLSNVPKMSDVGSAAYRRLQSKRNTGGN